ncbi:hypothetical protein [Lichenicola sp.]|uniref:hypothetical protein n=1 Tax=Lichenicola sp. TaxID=2804529 RepID=UPI003AFF78E0
MPDATTKRDGGRDTTLRTLSEELLRADNPKLLQITRMIDLLPERGQADLLLAPVRDRLSRLRPVRAMTTSRLLFVPFDPVLVAAGRWKPGELAVPRSIIRPLSALILENLDRTVFASSPAASLRLGEPDRAAVTRVGAPLWAASAQLLSDLVLPESWSTPAWQSQHGLTAAMARQLIAVIRLILGRAVELRTLPAPTDPLYEHLLTALLSDAARTGPLGWGIMLALLMDASAPDRVAAAATTLARGNRFATSLHAGLDAAVAGTLDRMQTLIDEPPTPADLLDPHGLDVRLGLIGRVEAFGRLQHRPPGEQRHVAALRQALSKANRLVFEQTLAARLPGSRKWGTDLPVPEPSGPVAAPLCTPAEVGVLESEARALRRFSLAAAKLGDGDQYDRLLLEAASRYAAADASLTDADRMRLTELLVGAEKTIQLFRLA